MLDRLVQPDGRPDPQRHLGQRAEGSEVDARTVEALVVDHQDVAGARDQAQARYQTGDVAVLQARTVRARGDRARHRLRLDGADDRQREALAQHRSAEVAHARTGRHRDDAPLAINRRTARPRVERDGIGVAIAVRHGDARERVARADNAHPAPAIRRILDESAQAGLVRRQMPAHRPGGGGPAPVDEPADAIAGRRGRVGVTTHGRTVDQRRRGIPSLARGTGRAK